MIHVRRFAKQGVPLLISLMLLPVLVAATPAPIQAPGPRPTPIVIAAAIPGGIAVPASIDATGASDASVALNRFVARVPKGSTIVFKAGGRYRMDTALKFANRTGLTFEGNGATLRSNGPSNETGSLFWLSVGNRDIVIRNFGLVGTSTSPGSYVAGKEGQHGIIAGGLNIEVSNVTVSAVWGDCFYVGGNTTNGVRFHDSTCASNGRNGVTITAGSGVTIERNTFVKVGYCTFDIEPTGSGAIASNIIFRNNTAHWTSGPYGGAFFAVDGGFTGSTINNITVSGNTVTGKSLRTVFNNGGTTRNSGVVFTNNSSTVAASGPVLIFAYIDGLTVTGNQQPLTSGSLASITNSTGVIYP